MSPHRMKRPWKGQTEKTAEDVNPGHDPQNPLSPGGLRAGGKVYFFLKCIFRLGWKPLEMIDDKLTSSGEPSELINQVAPLHNFALRHPYKNTLQTI